MKRQKQIGLLLIGISGAAFRCAEASSVYGRHAEAGIFTVFQHDHPVVMVLMNLVGIMMIIGICAIAFAAIFRSSGDI